MRCTRAATRASRCSSLASTPLPAPDVPTSPPPCSLHPAPRLFAPLRVLTRNTTLRPTLQLGARAAGPPLCLLQGRLPRVHRAVGAVAQRRALQMDERSRQRLGRQVRRRVLDRERRSGRDDATARVQCVCLALKPFGKAASELFLLSPRPSRRHLTAISLSLSPPFFPACTSDIFSNRLAKTLRFASRLTSTS